MHSGLGLGHIWRGNTPKRAEKHTKHARKSTNQHIAKHSTRHKTCHACSWGSGMSMYVHGGHLWTQMTLVDYKWGLGHENEATSTTDGHCGSWVHDRTVKIWRGGTRFGEEWQGRSAESWVRGWHDYWPKRPNKTKTKRQRGKQTSSKPKRPEQKPKGVDA